MFYINRQFVAGDDPVRLEWWNSLWQHPNFRAAQRVVTAVWGIAYLIEALLRVGFALVLPPRAAPLHEPHPATLHAPLPEGRGGAARVSRGQPIGNRVFF